MFALAATLASTGCKKGFTKVTPLPGQRAAVVGDTGGPTTVPPGNQLTDTGGMPVANTGNNTPTGGGPLSDTLDFGSSDPGPVRRWRLTRCISNLTARWCRTSEQANVASVGQALTADANAKLLIEGNCDERGTEEYNRALGERRALALREALAKIGIDPMRIRTISYGKDKPVDPGHDEAAWAKNRRGDFVLLPSEMTVRPAQSQGRVRARPFLLLYYPAAEA